MRKIGLFVLSALALASCNKTIVQTTLPPTPHVTPFERPVLISTHTTIVQAPPPRATPTPIVEATPPPATPEPNYFAPPGTFYLIKATSIETPEGIVGISPGRVLRLVSEGKYQMEEGGVLSLRPDQVTNDLRIAGRAAVNDQVAQAAIHRTMAMNEAIASGKATPPSNPGADKAARAAAQKELARQMELVRQQVGEITVQMSRLPDPNPKTSPEAAKLRDQKNALQDQLRALQNQQTLSRMY